MSRFACHLFSLLLLVLQPLGDGINQLTYIALYVTSVNVGGNGIGMRIQLYSANFKCAAHIAIGALIPEKPPLIGSSNLQASNHTYSLIVIWCRFAAFIDPMNIGFAHIIVFF